jgi:hypothetical protein
LKVQVLNAIASQRIAQKKPLLCALFKVLIKHGVGVGYGVSEEHDFLAWLELIAETQRVIVFPACILSRMIKGKTYSGVLVLRVVYVDACAMPHGLLRLRLVSLRN